jgi:Metallo-peptidase family M12
MRAMRFAPMARRLAIAAALWTVALACTLPARPGTALAQPTQINVEIDWMADGTHSHRPTAVEMQAVQQMFGCHGIFLNWVIDDSIPHVNVIPDSAQANPDTVFNFFTWIGPNSFASLKNTYFDNTGGGWHYCIFAHQYDPNGPATSTGSSGLGENGGDDFIVTLGTFTGQIGTPFDRAATFAHELGHNLGLNHYAGSDTSQGSLSPNYASIMSYQYQLTGVRTRMRCLDLCDSLTASTLKEIDYSNGRFPTINENSLSETRGVGIRSIDWDCSGSISGPVAKDLDGRPWCAAAGARTTLEDQNDWALIVDNTLTGRLPPPRYEPCITSEEVEQLKMMDPASCAAAQPTQLLDACNLGQMYWVSASYVGFEDGTGDTPYNTLMEAYNVAPWFSAIYLQPSGNYNTGGVVILNKPLTIAGPGVVTITP